MIDPLVSWSVVGLLLLAAAVSLLFLWLLRKLRRLLAHCAHWVEVDGRVAGTRVVEIPDGEYSSLRPEIIFDYTFGGRTYRGDNMTIGPPKSYMLEKSAERVIARYAPGARLSVWVDPDDPRQSVLERRAPFATVLIVCLAVLWVVTLGAIAVLLFAPGVVGPGPALQW